LLAEIIQNYARRIEAVSGQVHGSADGTARAVCAAGVHEEEVAGLRSRGFLLLVLEEPMNICRLDRDRD
jgi:hypothetical protein